MCRQSARIRQKNVNAITYMIASIYLEWTKYWTTYAPIYQNVTPDISIYMLLEQFTPTCQIVASNRAIYKMLD